MVQKGNNTLRFGLRLVLGVIPILAATAGTARANQAEESLRRALAWQIALERVGFSPGVIDGRIGSKTKLATREFQRVHGLAQTGELDKATADALKIDPDNAIARYTIQETDFREIGPTPKSWLAKSKLRFLGHDSLDAVLAEKFHCARHLLTTLNPGVNINALKAGSKIVVPAVEEYVDGVSAQRIEINLSEKVIRVIDGRDRLVALFHCSVAADKARMPSGQARVVCAVPDPNYSFDPKMWPEVKENIPGTINIPPGPRNPVGRFWIGLSKPGYGIHGTPNPELIGKTGSHGCFRLANWDAIRLGRMVSAGTDVRFVNHPNIELASRE